MALKDYLEKAGNIGMGALETVNAPFQVVGESMRGASESVPMKMASADDQTGYRWPSIVQRFAPSTRTDLPPTDPFVKSYQGLEGLATLPYGLQAASDMVTREPGMVEQIGGMGLGLGVMPPVAKKIANAEFPKVDLPEAVMNERGSVALGPGATSPAPAASPWFSRLEDSLQEKLPANADVGQVKNIMSTLPQEEAQVRGLDEFLSKRFGQVPKADIMEHLKQNRIDIGETQLGGNVPGAKVAQFEKYSTPGGSNYREVVMTLPDKREAFRVAQNEDYMALKGKVEKRLGQPVRNLYDVFDKGDLTFDETQKLVALDNRRNPYPEAFKSSHYPEVSNPVAHTRFKDFIDETSGKKTLLVDEIQSDWHQKGRTKGYQGDLERFTTPEEKELQALNHKTWVGSGKLTPAENIRQQELQSKVGVSLQEKVNRLKSGGVPNAPFKKNWHELAFKRALREAVEGGYDEMAWTTGEQQAQRYNLENHIKELHYQPNPDGTFHLSAQAQGRGISLGEKVPPDKLSEIVGKEIADRIVAGVGEKINYGANNEPGNFYKSLSGVDLKVGGEGMKGFYDDILPAYANKYLKKYGVKVADGPISAAGRQVSARGATGGRMKPGSFAVMDSQGQFLAGMPTEKEALLWAYKNKIPDFKVIPNDITENLIVHKIPITPEMKADILGKGQAMWKVPVAVGAGAAGAAASAEAEEQQFAEGGIVQKESNMPCRNMNQGGFAEDWKNDLAGYMDDHFGGGPEPTQHMADGGVAGDDDTDFMGVAKKAAMSALNPFFGGGLNRPAPAPAAAPIPPIPAPAPKPVFNPKAGLPPAAAPPPVASPTPAVPDAPTTPDPMLQAYLSQQREGLNKYGPDEQMAMEESIQKQRRGLIPNLALASTGLADAIMQGVARAGSSNFQSNLENRMDKTQEGQRKAFEGARTGHLAKMKQEMELATMDPESAISRVTQRTESPTLKAMGMSDEMIRQIPAGMMAQFRSGRLTLEDIRNKTEENRLKAEEYRLAREQRQREAEATAKKDAAEMAEKVQTRRIGAAKDLLTKSGNARAWGIPIPFTSDVSGKDKDAALAVLREGMQGATDYSSEEEATAAGLPVGTPITINGRPAVVE